MFVGILIRSDRGSNFTRADKELKEVVQGWNEHKINNFCGQKKIEWIFNPPSASHIGGVWERMIRSVRQILKALLKEQLVSDEVLSTVIAETVNILNSSPLTPNSDSPLDEQPLSPNHLLHLMSVQDYHQEYLRQMTSTADALGGRPNIWLILFWRR